MVTTTHNLQIVSRGAGAVDTIKLLDRFRNGELSTFDFGTCVLP